MEPTEPMHAPRQRISEADYLALEREAEHKSEWINGEMVAMAGATATHNALTMTLSHLLYSHLAGSPCKPFGGDMRLQISETGLYTYPDLMVVCGPIDFHPDDQLVVRNPKVVIEVLSPSTEAYDRGAKAAHYRRLASLDAYLFVSQVEHRIECYTRGSDGWQLTEATAGRLRVEPLDLSLDLAAVYAYTDGLRAELERRVR